MNLHISENWAGMIPPGEPQAYPGSSTQANHHVDTMACVSFSACHCLETQMRLFGDSMELSERFLAKLSGTTQNGNYLQTVFNTIKKFGLVSIQDWPELVEFTLEEFYADLPQAVIDKGQQWLKKYDVQFIPADLTALKTAPLWTVIKFVNGEQHAVERLSQGEFFDSYEYNGNYVKPLIEEVISNYLLLLIPKNMSNVKLVKNGGEYGFYLPATNEQSMIDKANNFGYALPTTDNGSKVDWPNVKADLTLT